MRGLLCLWLCLLVGVMHGVAHGQSEDPLALAALLLRDGHDVRAAEVLDAISVDDPTLDQGRYHALLGLISMQQQDHAAAARHFREAITASQSQGIAPEPSLFVQLSRAHLLDGAPQDALRVLGEGGDALNGLSSSHLIRARAHRDLGDMPAAYDALAIGAARFPQNRDFPRQQVLLLIEMGLTQQAGEMAAEMMEAADADVEDALTVAETLRQGGAIDRAAMVLEVARLRFPEAATVLVQQAVVAMTADQPLTAARFLQVATEYDPVYAAKSAELYRQANHLESALYMNAMVEDPVEKVRQRFGLLLTAEQFERAAALAPRLERLQLTADDDVAYGLAYAFFQIGELQAAEQMLVGIGDPAVFEKATALRSVLARCAESTGMCG